MALMLPRFYPIFDSAAWLARALPLGVKLVQLRLKDMDDTALRAEIRAGLALARQHGAALVVNDHWQIAMDEGAAWLHLGQEDLDTADIPAIRRAGLKLGLSTQWKRLAGDVPLCAIGGLTPERGRECLDAGADLVAAVTDITLNADPEGRMRDWLRVTA